MKRLALAVTAALLAASPARADIALLASGATLKVASHRIEQGIAFLVLKDGGEVGVPATELRGVVPDEVVEEATAAAPAGVADLVAATARRHGLDPELVRAVVAVESNFRTDAVSPKGAQGLMQLMPATARALGVKDAFDPAQNLDGGTRHLRALLARYSGDLKRALAAYNAGEGAVERHRGVPPYAETRAYVSKVIRLSRPEAAASGASGSP